MDSFLSIGTVLVLLVLPIWVTGFMRYSLTLMLAHGISVLSVTFLIRYSGEVSIGQNFFVATGAYAVAMLNNMFGVPFLASMVIAVVLSVLVGLLFALPSRGLSGVYLSVATLALGLAAPDLLLHFSDHTGGVEGLQIDATIIKAWPLDLQQYYLALAALVLAVYVIHRFRYSRLGLMILTAREHPHAAASFGMTRGAARLSTFALSAAIAGLGGAVFGFTTSMVSPNSFTFWSSVTLLVGSVVSYYSTRIYGVVVAGAFVALTPQLLSNYGQITPIIYGAVLLGATLLANVGVPAIARLIRLRRDSHV
ncbi:MAG: branched-chain amino acid ABC transporter permease [Ottowia sp.]|uniref:branched-chain amino acid ABC transporter permease n=1 Tax=Ottowia sp. TaxID=1898956 RepID=UPI003C794968